MREYQDLVIEAQSIIEDMPARHADVLREFIEAIHRRYRREGAVPEGDRIKLYTDGRHYISPNATNLSDRGRTYWEVEAILVPTDSQPGDSEEPPPDYPGDEDTAYEMRIETP